MSSPTGFDRSAVVRALFEALADLPAATRADHLGAVVDSVLAALTEHAQPGEPLVLTETERATLGAEALALANAADGPSVLDGYREAVQAHRGAVLGAGVDPAHLVGETVAQYAIRDWLGGGGMGDVYEAWDARLERTVALKFLPPYLGESARERFVREAKAASGLEHPHICTIHEIGESEDGQLYIAMPRYGGETLGDLIRRGPLPLAQAVGVAEQIASALHRAHEAGIVHRDVKPGNVMLTEHDQVKLLDFGIAKVTTAVEETILTQTGSRLGTVAYMSPEHARGEPVTAAADVWALGVVLYEMLTGTRPFTGAHDPALLLAIQDAAPAPVRTLRPDAPEPLAELVHQMLAKGPAQRTGSMQAVLDALRTLAPDRDASWGTAPPALPRITVTPSTSTTGAASRLRSVAREIAAKDIPLSSRWLWAGIGISTVALLALLRVLMVPEVEPAVVPVVMASDAREAVAVMAFDNLTGDPALDWVETALAEMLATNLSRYDGLRVISRQHLFDLRQQVSEAPGEVADAARAARQSDAEVARRAGATTMLVGSVFGRGERLRLSAQVVDAATGSIAQAVTLDATGGSDAPLLALTDSLTVRLASHLSVSLPGTAGRTGGRVAYTLTRSPEALRAYVDGLQALYRSRYRDAIGHFDEAVGVDSTFAMAYYHRELAASWITGRADEVALARALQFPDRLSRREHDLIMATLTMNGDLNERKRAFERLTTRYPDEKYAWYQLGEIYFHNYGARASVEALGRAREQDPNFLLAYPHLIDFYFHIDRYTTARDLVEEALALDSTNAEHQLSQAYLDAADRGTEDALRERLRTVDLGALNSYYRLDVQAAQAMLARDFGSIIDSLDAFRSAGQYGREGYLLATNSLAGLALLRGDLGQAERYLDDALRRGRDSPTQRYEAGLFALAHGDADEPEDAADDAIAHARAILNLYDSGAQPFPEVAALGWHLLVQAHLHAGETDAAQRAADALAPDLDGTSEEYAFLYDDARGRLACHAGDTRAALRHFSQARRRTSFTGSATGVVLLFSKLTLDAELACLETAGNHEAVLRQARAVPIYVYHFHDFNTSTMTAWLRSRLRIARAHDALGESAQAAAAYTAYLDFWRTADHPDARTAAARLAEIERTRAIAL